MLRHNLHRTNKNLKNRTFLSSPNRTANLPESVSQHYRNIIGTLSEQYRNIRTTFSNLKRGLLPKISPLSAKRQILTIVHSRIHAPNPSRPQPCPQQVAKWILCTDYLHIPKKKRTFARFLT